MKILKKFSLLRALKNCYGATAIEYALIAAIFAISAIGAFRTMGANLEEMYQETVTRVTEAINTVITQDRATVIDDDDADSA